jgi:transcription elongation factor Elf1
MFSPSSYLRQEPSMPKIHKEIHVHIPCPACGKTERVKLKWAEKHKSMKCSGCKKSVDLKANPARSLIARTSELVTAFEKTLEALHGEAKQAGKSVKTKARKPKKKTAKKKRAAKRASPKLADLPAEGQPSP